MHALACWWDWCNAVHRVLVDNFQMETTTRFRFWGGQGWSWPVNWTSGMWFWLLTFKCGYLWSWYLVGWRGSPPFWQSQGRPKKSRDRSNYRLSVGWCKTSFSEVQKRVDEIVRGFSLIADFWMDGHWKLKFGGLVGNPVPFGQTLMGPKMWGGLSNYRLSNWWS